MKVIKLQLHTVGEPGKRVVLAEAIDLENQAVVAALSLPMMDAWLKRHGFQYELGTNGVWRQENAA
jgi:hypothetical protein